MTHHHHHPGHHHPSPRLSPSLMRMSALSRLGGAAVLIVVLWGAVVWSMATP